MLRFTSRFFPFPEPAARDVLRVVTGFLVFLIAVSPAMFKNETPYLLTDSRPQEVCTKIETFSRLAK